MTAIKNLYLYGDRAQLERLKDEYEFLGRKVKLEDGRLTVFAIAPKKPKKKDRHDKSTRKSPRPTRD